MIANGSALIRVEAVVADQDATLIANGYEPIAVIGEAGAAKGWTTRPSTSIEAVTAERADLRCRGRCGPSCWRSSSGRGKLKNKASQGVNPNIISAKGFGETHPVASNDTPQGRKANRRIEITVQGPGAPGA
jgi:hypothetical protein